MNSVNRFLRFVLRYADDGLGLIGFVCLLRGVALFSRPSAWITAGVLLIAIAVGPKLRKRARGSHQ